MQPVELLPSNSVTVSTSNFLAQVMWDARSLWNSHQRWKHPFI